MKSKKMKDCTIYDRAKYIKHLANDILCDFDAAKKKHIKMRVNSIFLNAILAHAFVLAEKTRIDLDELPALNLFANKMNKVNKV